jgi:hypothetical protein
LRCVDYLLPTTYLTYLRSDSCHPSLPRHCCPAFDLASQRRHIYCPPPSHTQARDRIHTVASFRAADQACSCIYRCRLFAARPRLARPPASEVNSRAVTSHCWTFPPANFTCARYFDSSSPLHPSAQERLEANTYHRDFLIRPRRDTTSSAATKQAPRAQASSAIPSKSLFKQFSIHHLLPSSLHHLPYSRKQPSRRRTPSQPTFPGRCHERATSSTPPSRPARCRHFWRFSPTSSLG